MLVTPSKMSLLQKLLQSVQISIWRTWKGLTGEALYEHITQNKKMLFDFRKENSVTEWICTSDKAFGGNTEASFEKSRNGQAVFKGYLSTELPLEDTTSGVKVKYSGHAAIKSKPLIGLFNSIEPYDMSDFDTFELRIRGDGRAYFFNVQSEGYVRKKDDIHQAFMFTRGGPHWEIIRIPYNKFILTNHGYLQDHQMDFHKVRSFGISLNDKNDGEFRLEIDYIRLLRINVQPIEFEYQKENL